MAEIKELTKVEFRNGYWCVMILSPVKGIGFIVQGEHPTKEAAETDRKNWM